jgi:hypothetical protein
MDMCGKSSKGDRPLSASELAQTGRCERPVVFEHLHSRRPTKGQQRARARGLLAHEQFRREGLEAVAAAAWRQLQGINAARPFGEAWQDQVARQHKDVLRRTRRLSRWLSMLYCRTAGRIRAVLRQWTKLKATARAAWASIVARLRWRPRRSDERLR